MYKSQSFSHMFWVAVFCIMPPCSLVTEVLEEPTTSNCRAEEEVRQDGKWVGDKQFTATDMTRPKKYRDKTDF